MRLLRVLVLVAAGCASRHAAAPSAPAATVSERSSFTSAGPNVDGMIREAWRSASITPAPPVDDARYLRRAYIDLVGTIPPPDVAAAFIDDRSPDKRKKLVQRLVDSPEFVDHWVEYWDAELMGRDMKGMQDVDRAAFRAWLRARVQKNAPWDAFVRDIVTATGANSAGGPRDKNPAFGESEREPEAEGVNGAVNFTLRFQMTPQDMAGTVSREFLGVQIQCAQCHDHKTERWKQADFQRFAAAFVRTRIEQVDKGKTMGVRRVEVADLPRPAPRFAKNGELAAILAAKPTALDGTDLSSSPGGVRKSLADWMTSEKNPWFSRAIVNRMWGHFLGRGFVDPVDDFRPSNPPTLEHVLDALAKDFVAHGYDLKHLMKTICATEVYQLSAGAQAKPGSDNPLWAKFRVTPLGPEELLNSLLAATRVGAAAKRLSFGNMEQLRARVAREYAFTFDVDEDFEQKSFEGTISQALMLLNGTLVGVGTTAIPGGALDEVLASSTDDEKRIASLYLRTLSRRPDAAELERAKNYVQNPSAPPPDDPKGVKLRKPRIKGAPADNFRAFVERKLPATSDPKRAAYEDLLWALVNSSEFTFNH
jgi:hypothetical protein